MQWATPSQHRLQRTSCLQVHGDRIATRTTDSNNNNWYKQQLIATTTDSNNNNCWKKDSESSRVPGIILQGQQQFRKNPFLVRIKKIFTKSNDHRSLLSYNLPLPLLIRSWKTENVKFITDIQRFCNELTLVNPALNNGSIDGSSSMSSELRKPKHKVD